MATEDLRTDKSSVKKWLTKRKSKAEEERDTNWAFLKKKYDLAITLRRPFERRWLIVLSFLAGRQYVFYNETAEMLQQVLLRKGKVRIVDNKLLPRYRKQVSRLIKNSPNVVVVPSSNDQEDIEAARKGTKFLLHFWRNAKMKKKVRELGGWIYGTGNGFLSDAWDSKKGPTRLDAEKGELVYEGDATCGVWSPFEVGFPVTGLGDTDLHDFPWMVRMKYRSLEYLASHYERGREVLNEQRAPGTLDVAMLWNPSGDIGSEVEGATLIELYVKPNVEFPEGLFLAGANKVMLEKSIYPFNHFHMEQFKDIEIPGVFWGMATTEAAIWLQKIHNKTLSDIVEFNKIMARGKFLIPRGSKMEVEPDDTHGQKLLYTPVMGHKPEILDLKGLPATYDKALMLVAQGLMELYHQHEVTQGTNKSDIRSADMVELLLESDDMGNIPTHAVFEEALEACLHRVLLRVQKGYTTERMIKISGEGNSYEVLSFKGADLKGNTDVFVKKESSLPDSRVVRNKRVMDRFQATLYGDPNDPGVKRKVLKMLDDAITEDIYGETWLDEQNANVENRAMLAQPGIVMPSNDYDNDGVHLQTHINFRKGRTYQKVKEGNQERGLIVDATFQTHEAFHKKALEERMKMQEKVINLRERRK
uniref:Portal protein n=1 Tax=viral metagenome TaxID=1070528 RepID=A0A6H1ZBH9_9ZZZZ